MLDKIYNIFICGTGGQGVLKAAEVCGKAAIIEGYHVKQSEVHGMAQRGGSVESHLRFGKKVYSPLIPDGKADLLVPFFKEERDRLVHYLNSESGEDLVEYLIKGEEMIKNKKMINTFMLGVSSKYLPLKEESWIEAIKEVFLRMTDENIEVFKMGRGIV